MRSDTIPEEEDDYLSGEDEEEGDEEDFSGDDEDDEQYSDDEDYDDGGSPVDHLRLTGGSYRAPSDKPLPVDVWRAKNVVTQELKTVGVWTGASL